MKNCSTKYQISGWLAIFVIMLMTTAFLILTAGATTIVGVYKSDSSEDSIFTEIHITAEGAYGVSKGGEEYEFDYEDGGFKKATDKSETKVVFGSKDRDAKRALEDFPMPELLDGLGDIEITDLPELLELEKYEEILSARETQRELMEARKVQGLKFTTTIVEEDDVVKGPLVSLGHVIVRGEVRGNVLSYKRITVTATGLITGNATAPEIDIIRGGVIEGSTKETGLPPIPEIDIFGEQGSPVPLVTIASIYVGLILLGLLTLAGFSRPIGRIRECVKTSSLKSFFVGLLFWFAYGPLVGLLVFTIIGIPIAAIALPLATVVASLLGLFVSAELFGAKFGPSFGNFGSSKSGKFIVGFTMLFSSWIAMALLMLSSSSTMQGFATFFMVVAIMISSIIVSIGIGAVILTRFGTREHLIGIKVNISTENAPPPPSPPPLKTDDE